MKKNAILYAVALLIIFKAFFNKKLGLDELNVFSIIYYVLLVALTFILIKSYKPKTRSFWIAMLIYILLVVAISVYSFFG